MQKRNRDLKNKKSEYKKIEKIAKNFLKMEVPDNETLKKLVKRIEFDKNKKITVKLTFSEIQVHRYNLNIGYIIPKNKNVEIQQQQGIQKKWYIDIT